MVNDRKETAVYVAYEDWKAYDFASPEKKLLQAILINAMQDLERKDFAGKLAKQFTHGFPV